MPFQIHKIEQIVYGQLSVRFCFESSNFSKLCYLHCCKTQNRSQLNNKPGLQL